MAKNHQKPVNINELRWPIYVARRDQTPDATTGIDEAYADIQIIHAKIEPLYATTFYGAQQTDRPITHMIWIRHLDYLDDTYAVVRDRLLRDGTAQRDVFRIRRIKNVAGRQRFMELEVELEQRVPV